MILTGTLIDDLMAAVERVEQRASANAAVEMSLSLNPDFSEASLIEPWFASIHANNEHDYKFLGVA